MAAATLYYGNVKEDVWLICKWVDENRIYRKEDCLNISGYDNWHWGNLKQGGEIIWWPKKEPGFNRELSQVWHLESTMDKHSFYIKDHKDIYYLCYGDNKTMFLSNNASDKKIIFKYGWD